MDKKLIDLLEEATTPMEKMTLVSVYYDGKTQKILNDIEKGDMMPSETVRVIVSSFYMEFWNIFKSIPHLYILYSSSYREQINSLDNASRALHEELYSLVFNRI